MMKKYLLTGVAALALCTGFTACSDHDFDVVGGEQAVVQTYNEAFIRVFGEPAANHTWGFSSAEFPPSKVTRSENANANEWADPNKDYGGLLVPPPLTAEQKAVVKKYFQTHPNLGYEDPGWTNYFIQQVYKGYTDVPEGCATPEKYLAASGSSYIIASDHMDHLVAVDPDNSFVDHINNFNHGDCSTNGTVLDNGGNANDGPFHSDKIMYMKESTTKSFGYHNSDGSLYHTEYTGLVSYRTIMQAMGSEADCLNDGWNRSFMGFDFEQMVGNDVYAADRVYGNYSAENNWQGELISETYKYFEFEGNQYHFLDANTNMYAADLTEESYKEKNGSTSTIGGKANFNDRPSDDIIRDLLSKGYLPYSDTLKDWVKVGGTADGYYSDWIVTLTEANTSIVEPANLRVIVEDLSATQATDFDFNDVVFDVYYGDAGSAYLMVQAAGGTLPLTVAGVEVHRLFGYSTDVMINTNARTGVSGIPAKRISLDFAVISPEDVRDLIEIKVTKRVLNEETGEYEPTEILIEATTGEPAAKVAVVPTFQWVNERHSMKDDYPSFRDYVLDPNAIWDGNN